MFHLSEKSLSRLDAQGLTALLRAEHSPQAASALLPAAAALAVVSLPLVRAFLDTVETDAQAHALLVQLQQLPAHSLGANGHWLLAELVQQTAGSAETKTANADSAKNENACTHWQRLVDTGGGGEMAEASLALARALLREGKADEALEQLRSALQVPGNPLDFLQKAERLYRALATRVSTPGKPLRLAVLGSSTTTFLVCALRMAAVRDGFAPEIYESPYGAFRQEIMDGQSALYAFKPQFVLIATHWRDAALPALDTDAPNDSVASAADFADGADTKTTAQSPGDDGTASPDDDAVATTLAQLQHLWHLLLSRLSCTVLQNNFDLPWEDSAGHLGFASAAGRSRRLLALNEAMRAQAPQGVVIVEADMLSAIAGKRQWNDERQWYMSKQHPAPECLPLLADAYLSLIRASLGMARKVLVLDLDDTLWGGVIGEDGIGGIRLGPPYAEGEAYAAFQHYLLELKARGVLLAVCSKNNEADAKEPFDQHESMVLRLDDFVAFHANWQDKPQNLRQIAQTLNLGLDSFVFVDDNPAERAQVRRQLPQVAVPQIDRANPAGYIAAVQQGLYFESTTLSAEDKNRSADYAANARRDSLLNAATDRESFLHQLQMRVSHGAFDQRVFERVIQLLGKTNQFNLTTRRHSPEQVRRLMDDPAVWTQWFSLKDRFGDNGLIGLLIATPTAADVWEIDTFLMSCRVIGRDMETYMIATLLQAASQRGIRRVTGRYLPTAKNAIVSNLYEKLGFRAQADSTTGTWQFESAGQTPPAPAYFSRS